MENPGVLIVPGVTDAIGARLVERSQFEACYVTGAGIANAQHGLPDIGIVSMAEAVSHVNQIANATSLPLLVDIDNGYGGPLAVLRAVRLFEDAGAAAIQIEDQTSPKRCGHFDTHSLVTAGEMQAKIDAAARARQDPNLIIIARTDAYGVEGVEQSIRRSRLYVETGADALFVEAPASREDLRRIGAELAGVPLIVNVVEGGKTPELPVSELGDLGYKIALFANFLLRRMLKAGESGLEHLRETGETLSLANEMLSWDERQELVGLSTYSALEDYFEDRYALPSEVQ